MAQAGVLREAIDLEYELGRSTGALTRKLAARHPGTRWAGIDVEPDMIAQATCITGSTVFVQSPTT